MHETDWTSWMARGGSGAPLAGGHAGLDPTTGLLDEASFLWELEAALAECRRDDRQLTLLLMAPGGLGSSGRHPEDLLVRFASRLRDGGTALLAPARLTGNRFAVLLVDGQEPDGAERLVGRLAARLDRAGAGGEMDAIGGGGRPAPVPVGAAVFPRDGEEPFKLLDVAERALWLVDRMTRQAALPAGCPYPAWNASAPALKLASLSAEASLLPGLGYPET